MVFNTDMTTSLTYIGDFEEVEDYIRSQLIKPGTFSDDPCLVDKFDAIAALRGELFIFVGKVCTSYKPCVYTYFSI